MRAIIRNRQWLIKRFRAFPYPAARASACSYAVSFRLQFLRIMAKVDVLAVKRNFAKRSPAPVLPSSGKRVPTGSRSARGIGAVIERVYIISRFLPLLSPEFSQNPRARLLLATGGTDMQKQNKIRDGIWLDPG